MMLSLPLLLLTLLGATDAPPVDPQHLIVVAPAEWAKTLEPFIRFKQSRPGIASCTLLSLESATAEGPGDAAERLKRALYLKWREQRCDAVLLVGDASVLPFRYMMLDRVTAPAFDTAFYPSDLYFGDLARADGSFDDWNGAHEGHHAQYFGEVHGEHHKTPPVNFDSISYLPEIAVGRWPARTEAEALSIAAKSMRTENAWRSQRSTPAAAPAEHAPVPRKHSVLLVAAGGWIDNQARMELLAREDAPWQPTLLAWFTPEHPASEDAVREQLITAPRMIFHTGHGQPWGWEHCLTRKTLSHNSGVAELPVLFSIGCSTAEVAPQPPYQPYLDAQGVRHRGTNAGEVFDSPPPPPAVIQPLDLDATSISEDALRSPKGGAAAAIGCVAGSQPCAHTLLDGFVEAARSTPGATIGEWWKAAIHHYHATEKLDSLTPTKSWYPASVYFQGMKFVLLGDPTLRALD